MSFLLDTNVASEPTRLRPSGKVVAWLRATPSNDLFLSVITLGEIRKGIELSRTGAPHVTSRVEQWLTLVNLEYRTRVLELDEDAADIWGRIMAAHPRVPIEDGQIAAIAIRHDMTVVTRNVRDIAKTGARYLNPY